MKRFYFFLVMLFLTVAASAAKFPGNIGPYEITMVTDSKGNYLYYYYNSRPNSHFKLVMDSQRQCSDSEWNGDGCRMVRFHEVTPSGNISGRFSGQEVYRLRSNGSYVEISGTFTNTSSGKKFEFTINGYLPH